MKFGYVRIGNGVVKSINLDNIRLIEIDTDSIIIRYGGNNSISTSNLNGAYFISINNTNNIASGTISENFYAWLKNSLTALKTQRILLNDYMVGFEIVTAGIGGISGPLSQAMTFQTAADSAAACALSGGTAGVIDSKIGAAIGNLVLEGTSGSNDLKPIADGNYSLIINGVKYFATFVSSRISAVEVCPLSLDFVYDPNQQADGVANLPNYFTFAQSSYLMWNYYSGLGDISVNGGSGMMSCSTMNSYLRTVNSGGSIGDKTWPCGHIFNGLLDAAKGLGVLPAFAIVLNDSSVADLNSAQIYISQDYYVTGDKDQASWFPFGIDFWGAGFATFGNGTSTPSGNGFLSIQNALLYNMGSLGRIFFPASTSLVNPATSIDAGYANFNNAGVISSSTYCP